LSFLVVAVIGDGERVTAMTMASRNLLSTKA
jgi:hypothetical protein